MEDKIVFNNDDAVKECSLKYRWKYDWFNDPIVHPQIAGQFIYNKTDDEAKMDKLHKVIDIWSIQCVNIKHLTNIEKKEIKF